MNQVVTGLTQDLHDLQNSTVPEQVTDPSKGLYFRIPNGVANAVDFGALLLPDSNRAKRPGVVDQPSRCPVCPQERGAQPGVPYLKKWEILKNPYGVVPSPYTVIQQAREPDGCPQQSALIQRDETELVVKLLIQLIKDRVGNLALHNGQVGNSLHHDHAQAMTLPAGVGLPLFDGGLVGDRGLRRPTIQTLRAPQWPLPAFVVSSEAADAASLLGQIAERWGQLGGDSARANIIAARCGSEIRIAYVPRSTVYHKMLGFEGSPASLEVCGLFVAGSQMDRERILHGRLRHSDLWLGLAGLKPEGVDRLAEEVRTWRV